MSASHAPGVDDFVNELLGEPEPGSTPEQEKAAETPPPEVAVTPPSDVAVEPVEEPTPPRASVPAGDAENVADADLPVAEPAVVGESNEQPPGPVTETNLPIQAAPASAARPETPPAVAPPVNLEDWMQPASHPAEEQLHTPLLRCVSFRLQGQLYAAPVDSLLEVLSRAEIVPIPSKGYPVLGILNLRGSIVTVIDPANLLALPPATDPQGRLIVVDYASEPVALRVDEVLEVVSLDESELQPPPENARHMQGLIESGGDMLTLLDLKLLVARAFGRD